MEENRPSTRAAPSLARTALLIAFLAGIAVVAATLGYARRAVTPPDETPEESSAPLPQSVPRAAAVLPDFMGPLPNAVRHDVPFSTQAPNGDWASPFDEACEETSVAMAMAWARGEREKLIEPESVAAVILEMVEYERFNFGYHEDTNLADTLLLFRHYYRHSAAEVRPIESPDDIKRALAGGNIVLLPVMGELLANPFYQTPPPYHMVLATGYNNSRGIFTVHDPGTKRGADYPYAENTLWNAIHDWTGDEATLELGKKAMLVVGPMLRAPTAESRGAF